MFMTRAWFLFQGTRPADDLPETIFVPLFPDVIPFIREVYCAPMLLKHHNGDGAIAVMPC